MKTSKLFTLSIFKFNHIPFNVSFLYWFLKNFTFDFSSGLELSFDFKIKYPIQEAIPITKTTITNAKISLSEKLLPPIRIYVI